MMAKSMVCNWCEEDDFYGGFWQTSCEQIFYFTDGGTPAENDFAFCPYCGKVLNGIELEVEVDE